MTSKEVAAIDELIDVPMPSIVSMINHRRHERAARAARVSRFEGCSVEKVPADRAPNADIFVMNGIAGGVGVFTDEGLHTIVETVRVEQRRRANLAQVVEAAKKALAAVREAGVTVEASFGGEAV